MTEYRAYHLGNFYLSSIQQGIQAAHAQTNMIKKYVFDELTELTEYNNRFILPESSKLHIIRKWCNEPTMYCLNGGDDTAMLEHFKFLELECYTYPYAQFKEEGCRNLLTNIICVVPSKIFEAKQLTRQTYKTYDPIKDIKYSHRPKSVEDFLYTAFNSSPPLMKIMQNELTKFLSERSENEFTSEDAKLADFLGGFRLAN